MAWVPARGEYQHLFRSEVWLRRRCLDLEWNPKGSRRKPSGNAGHPSDFLDSFGFLGGSPGVSTQITSFLPSRSRISGKSATRWTRSSSGRSSPDVVATSRASDSARIRLDVDQPHAVGGLEPGHDPRPPRCIRALAVREASIHRRFCPRLGPASLGSPTLLAGGGRSDWGWQRRRHPRRSTRLRRPSH